MREGTETAAGEEKDADNIGKYSGNHSFSGFEY